MANTALKVADLDFFSIKKNLKDFLRNQKEFSDYDFEGSGMSVLLDTLAYNTYYNAFYLNMAANEAFLDSAQIRQNILSLAKSIGYVPQSPQACQAQVNIRIVPQEDEEVNYIILEKGIRFIGSDKGGMNYSFVTVNSNSASKVDGVFNFANVVIKQGEFKAYQYAVDANTSLRRYQIPSSNVDTSTLIINVQESSSNTYTESYELADDLTVITANSRVYYIEEDQDLNYSFYFGDGVIGKRPKDGNIITISYLETAGGIANGIQRFVVSDSIANVFRTGVTVTTNKFSYGGVDRESVEQIRFRAPHYYTAQNRAVTKADYEALITRDYPNIEAISVWGGEENDPPVYGKVYMSMKTKGYYSLTNLEKEIIKNELISNRNVLTVVPEIVDPNYCFILVKGHVTFNPSMTSKTQNELLSVVRKAISDYSKAELNTFDSTFRKSRLQYYIEECDPAITGSNLKYYIQQRIPLTFNREQQYSIDFSTTISKGSINDKLYSFPSIQIDDAGTSRYVLIEEVPSAYTGIDSILLTNAGYGYLSEPTVTISGDGTGATARATIVNGRVESIKIVNEGINYTSASVAITSKSGVEASAVARLQSRYGHLRTYYYNSKGEKIIVNPDIGTIDYKTGKINIYKLTPYSVKTNSSYDNNIVTLNALPDNDIVSPLRNRIISIDSNDPLAIVIDLVPET